MPYQSCSAIAIAGKAKTHSNEQRSVRERALCRHVYLELSAEAEQKRGARSSAAAAVAAAMAATRARVEMRNMNRRSTGKRIATGPRPTEWVAT